MHAQKQFSPLAFIRALLPFKAFTNALGTRWGRVFDVLLAFLKISWTLATRRPKRQQHNKSHAVWQNTKSNVTGCRPIKWGDICYINDTCIIHLSILYEVNVCLYRPNRSILTANVVRGQYTSVGRYNLILTEHKSYNCYITNHHINKCIISINKVILKPH